MGDADHRLDSDTFGGGDGGMGALPAFFTMGGDDGGLGSLEGEELGGSLEDDGMALQPGLSGTSDPGMIPGMETGLGFALDGGAGDVFGSLEGGDGITGAGGGDLPDFFGGGPTTGDLLDNNQAEEAAAAAIAMPPVHPDAAGLSSEADSWGRTRDEFARLQQSVLQRRTQAAPDLSSEVTLDDAALSSMFNFALGDDGDEDGADGDGDGDGTNAQPSDAPAVSAVSATPEEQPEDPAVVGDEIQDPAIVSAIEATPASGAPSDPASIPTSATSVAGMPPPPVPGHPGMHPMHPYGMPPPGYPGMPRGYPPHMLPPGARPGFPPARGPWGMPPPAYMRMPPRPAPQHGVRMTVPKGYATPAWVVSPNAEHHQHPSRRGGHQRDNQAGRPGQQHQTQKHAQGSGGGGGGGGGGRDRAGSDSSTGGGPAQSRPRSGSTGRRDSFGKDSGPSYGSYPSKGPIGPRLSPAIAAISGGVPVPPSVCGSRMSAREVRQVVILHSASLLAQAQTGDEFKDNYYFHALNDKRRRAAAAAAAASGNPYAMAAIPPPIMPMPDQALRSEGETAIGGFERLLQRRTRHWESENRVLGHTSRSSLRRPRELLQLSTDESNPSSGTDAPEPAAGGAGAGAGASSGAGASADEPGAGSLLGTTRNQEVVQLWRGRAAVETVAVALMNLDDAERVLESYQQSWRPVPQGTITGQQQRVAALQNVLAMAIGLGSTSGPSEPGTTPTPGEELPLLLSMTKGKKILCRAVPRLSPNGLTRAVTFAMRLLPHFVASTLTGDEVERVDAELATALAAWTGTAASHGRLPGAPRKPLDFISDCVEELIVHHDADVLRALCHHPGGAEVITAIVTRGEEEVQAIAAASQESVDPAVSRWHEVSERLGQAFAAE